MTLQELEALIKDCKTRKSMCLNTILEGKSSKKHEYLCEKLAESLASTEIHAQIAYVYAMREQRDNQDPNAKF